MAYPQLSLWSPSSRTTERSCTDIQNVTSSSIVNAVLEAARDINSPIILQVSQGGAAFFGGKGLKNSAEKQEASVAGSIAAAHFIRAIAPAYGV